MVDFFYLSTQGYFKKYDYSTVGREPSERTVLEE